MARKLAFSMVVAAVAMFGFAGAAFACGSDSDCSYGTCSSGTCGHCGSDSDCKGGSCNSGHCSNADPH